MLSPVTDLQQEAKRQIGDQDILYGGGHRGSTFLPRVSELCRVPYGHAT